MKESNTKATGLKIAATGKVFLLVPMATSTKEIGKKIKETV